MEFTMAIRPVYLLGHPLLYETSAAISRNELAGLQDTITDLHDTMVDFRDKYGAGRAIAAPQIGVMKRLIYMNIEEQATVFINPELEPVGGETMTVWDDCMCFPNLLVKVHRYRCCRIHYRDLSWQEHTLALEGDLAELLQHEYDHLDGILAVSRAIDDRSFAFANQRRHLN